MVYIPILSGFAPPFRILSRDAMSRSLGQSLRPAVAGLVCFTMLATGRAASSKGDGEQLFKSTIQPIFIEHCHKCHSHQADKIKGGLVVDSLSGLLTGGDTGPAVVPGEPEKSLLIKAIRYTDEDLQMPPKGKRLSDQQISALTQWVKLGAPWPGSDPNKVAR